MDKVDMVSHPPHYQSETGLEVMEVIEAFTEGLTGIEATHTGNILKYMCRWKKKNGLEDLKKAQYYLNDLISRIERKERPTAKDRVWNTYEDAWNVLDNMKMMLGCCGSVSVAELYNLADLVFAENDKKWGWTNLDDAFVTECPDGFTIELPTPERI